MSAEAPRRFRIARNPDASRGAMGYARRYSRLEDAFADMGDGVVFDDSGAIVAYHERHAVLLEHRGRDGASPRMANFTPPPAADEYTRGGLRVRRWPSLDPGMLALVLPSGDHVIVPELYADDIQLLENPFEARS